jgi:phosphoribosylanthranilate isomerase
MRVKICGITREEDAGSAVEAGAGALGFIFVPSSRRYITPADAGTIVRSLPPLVTTVGVFADAPRQDVLSAIRSSGISCLQFHGRESPEDMSGYPLPVYKAFRVSSNFDVSMLAAYPGPAYLLDAFAEGEAGGTGKSFDWQVALRAKQFGRIILAGGLTPENVSEAIRVVSPYAIDVSSGVEESPGVKSGEKIRALLEAVKVGEGTVRRISQE